ncbi:MAG TPA: hypothetical protein VMF65_25840 [Acidimicrobiales bacterium]|nr:hypothetical protein [Acidimicrobiales bacterium]
MDERPPRCSRLGALEHKTDTVTRLDCLIAFRDPGPDLGGDLLVKAQFVLEHVE